MTNSTNQSLFGNLWERKVPQFVATYFGVCFTIIQFLNFVTNRYSIDSSLIDKFITFCAVALPALVLFTYNHGRPGHDPWTKLEKVFIPFNLLVAGALAFFVSGVSNTTAAPTEVTITNDEGMEVSRMVPGEGQVKKLAFFPFEIEGEDEDPDWIRYGLPLLLEQDLEQDMRIYGRSADTYEMALESRNYKLKDKIPFSVQLDIAKNSMANYLLSGTVNSAGSDWMVDVEVHDAQTGELFMKQSFEGPSIYDITDKISDQLHGQLFLDENEGGFSDFVDLPAEDLISTELEAFKAYVKGRELLVNNNHQAALPILLESLRLDDKSPMIASILASCVWAAGDMQGAAQYAASALKLGDRLTERNKFDVKRMYYAFNNDVDKMLALSENWITLYPKDFQPYESLMNIYSMTNQLDKAKAVGVKAMANGHRRRVLKEMFDISIKADEFDAAEKYLTEHEKEFPVLAKRDKRRGELYEKKGEFDNSITYYEGLLLDDPENGLIISKIAQQYLNKGDLENYNVHMDKALSKAERAIDSVAIIDDKLRTSASLGWKDEYLKLITDKHNCQRTYMPEMAIMSLSFQDLAFGASTGAQSYFVDYYDALAKANPQMKVVTDCVSAFLINLIQRNLEPFKQVYQGQCKSLVLQGTPDLGLMAEGYVASMEKDYDTAILKIEEYIEATGSGNALMGSVLAEQFRLKGEPRKSIEICKNYLKTYPYSSGYLFELCQAQVAAMDTEGAKKTYGKLSAMWSDAHPDFIYYDDYKELGKQLSI